MAAINGHAGTVNFDGALAEVTSYTLDTVNDTAETSTIGGGAARTYVSTMQSFSGSIDFILEGGSDTPQFDANEALDVASKNIPITFELFPEGAADTSGEIKFSGSAIATGVSYTSTPDSLVTGTVTFQGTGALTTAVVA
jgi:hypothetical protein